MATQDKAGSPEGPFSAGDGLILKGLVVAVDTLDKNWEGKHYVQRKASISDGKRTYAYTATDRNGPLPEIQVFQRCEVLVESARSEKGNLSVTGQFFQSKEAVSVGK